MEARMVNGKISVLYILNEDWADEAKRWLAANAPGLETLVLGKPAMHWEFPDEFNKAVKAFLSKSK